MHTRAGITCGLILALSRGLTAQVPSDIDVTATAAYALIWNRAASGTDSLGTAIGARFNGRVGIRVARTVYVGVTAGSWMYAPTTGHYDPHFGVLTEAVATAVVASSYVQWYPRPPSAFFLRGGIGYANSATYYPAQSQTGPAPLAEVRSTRLSLSMGAGIDLPLRQHFAVTVSADYTQLFGNATFLEPVSALLLGLGLTVH